MDANPCDTCALREGTITHDKEPYNAFRGLICALAGIPFYCHHGLNWKKHIGVRKGIAFDTEATHRRLHVCEGWKREVIKHIPQGPEHRLTRMVRRAIGEECMETLEAALGETRAAEKNELWAHLRELVVRLRKKGKLKLRRVS